MKILVLNYEFPPVGGGGGKVAEDICGILARRGHQIRVQTSHVKGLPKYEQRDGYQIFRSFSFRSHLDHCSVYEMGAYLLTNLFPVLNHVLFWKPDVVHAHFAVPTGFLAFFVNLLTGVPYVITAHLGDVPGGVPDQTDHIFKAIKPMTTPIWKRAAAVTAVSEFTKQLAVKSYDVNVQTIHNGIDIGNCKQSQTEPQGTVNLIFVGRFNPQKNILFMLALLARILDLNWHLQMVGDGPLKDKVCHKIIEEGLDGRVTLHGWVNPKRVDEIMSKSDILVLPSLSEGLPVVGVAALAHGLAILGSKIGGISDVVIDGQNGSLCSVNDFNEFEQALRSMLLSKKKLRHMKMSSREMAEKFDLVKIAKKYESIFKKVINNKRDTTR